MGTRSLIVLGAVVLGAGCRPPEPVMPEFAQISGTWEYAGQAHHDLGIQCLIEDVQMSFEQIPGAGAFDGESTGGSMSCRHGAQSYAYALPGYPILNGYVLDPDIAFDFYNADWRHEGKLVGDTVNGSFTLRSGGQRYNGTFRAVRISRR